MRGVSNRSNETETWMCGRTMWIWNGGMIGRSVISSIMKICTDFPLAPENIAGGFMKPFEKTVIMTRDDFFGSTKPVEDSEWFESEKIDFLWNLR